MTAKNPFESDPRNGPTHYVCGVVFYNGFYAVRVARIGHGFSPVGSTRDPDSLAFARSVFRFSGCSAAGKKKADEGMSAFFLLCPCSVSDNAQ